MQALNKVSEVSAFNSQPFPFSYLICFSREIAEGSPYLEALRKKDAEVLFLYEPYDELVLMNLGQFEKKTLKSIENELVEDKEDNTNTVDEKGNLDVHFLNKQCLIPVSLKNNYITNHNLT